MKVFCCCHEPLSDNCESMVETEISFNKLKQLHASTNAEISEALMVSNHLEVYTGVLHETLRDVFAGIGHMNMMIIELQEKLDHCIVDNEMLELKLHAARGEADILRKTEAQCVTKYDNLLSKNHIMEVKFHNALDEKSFLAQKIADCQRLIGEYRAYESKYKASVAEKNEIESMLKEEKSQRTYLQCEINSMVEDLKSLKESYDMQCILNSNLQKCAIYLQHKLRDLCNDMISCFQQVSCTRFDDISDLEEELNSENYDAIISCLEQLQQETCHMLIKLHQEKKLAEKQRDLVQGTLYEKDSHISSLKQQFKSDLEEVTTRLVLSNMNVENLQFEIHDIVEQLRHSMEMEERQILNNRQLLSKMANFCNGMISCNQQISCSLFDDIPVPEKLNYENYDAIIFLLEHFERDACHKLVKFHQEKKLAEEQREIVQCALNMKESHISSMKQQFESELEETRRKLKLSNIKVEELQVELQDTVDKLKLSITNEERHRLTRRYFSSKMANLCNRIISCYQQVGDSFFDDISVSQELNGENYDALISFLEQFQQASCHKLVKFHQVQKLVNEQREISERTLNAKELHISSMKQQFESELAEIRTKLELSNEKVENLQVELQDTEEKLKFRIKTEEKHRSKNRELSSKMAILEIDLQQRTDECRDFYQKILVAESVNEELARTKSSLTDCLLESKNLLSSIQSGNDASIKMENEISNLRENLHFVCEQLQSERKLHEKLDIIVADITSELEATNEKIFSLDEQNAELHYLRTRVLDLEREMQCYLVYYKENQRKTNAETSSLHLQVADLDDHLASAIMHLVSSDVEVTFVRNQLYSMKEEILEHQKKSKAVLEELYLMHMDDVTSIKKYLANEADFVPEKEHLSTDLQSTKSKLELIIGEKQNLLDYYNDNTIMLANFEDLKAKEACFEADCFERKHQYEVESCILRNMLPSFAVELDELWLSKVELDIMVVFLRTKVDACECELRKLRAQNNELNQKLLEQILKTEQFKNLSIHLRELKDKADAECHQTRERRELEGSSVAVQESLRMAFIKEQYESKIQELRNQCSVSQKYAEEMLMKLQYALDEIESRKKNEASLTKRNEDMSIELSYLDIELQTTATDRKELIKSYDRMKAELECTVLCLECCKEEKLKLENSLKDSSEEREKNIIELDLVKRLLENMATSTGDGRRHHVAVNQKATLIGELLGDGCSGTSVVFQETPSTRSGSCIVDDQVTKGGADYVYETGQLNSCRELEDVEPTSFTGGSCLSVQLEQTGNLVKETALDRVTLLENNVKQIADMKEHFKEQQSLMAGMELLHNQLERLKNDNLSSDFQLDEKYLTADLQGLKRELSQLDMVNEQLESIFPSYKNLSCFGNAVERVLALELELAESLQMRKKSKGHIQSSFLKQHSDEEAVFMSFRDINELIKDMLELKRRNAAVENELHEMHGRYSQLSLQFAEVEGERQKLIMSLKNRTTKKS